VRDGRVAAREPRRYATPRTELEPAYRGDGGHLVARVPYLRAHRDFLGPDTAAFEGPENERVDIDTPGDFAFAEFLVGRAAHKRDRP